MRGACVRVGGLRLLSRVQPHSSPTYFHTTIYVDFTGPRIHVGVADTGEGYFANDAVTWHICAEGTPPATLLRDSLFTFLFILMHFDADASATLTRHVRLFFLCSMQNARCKMQMTMQKL